MAVLKGRTTMAYEPPFQRNDAIDSLCMEIAELVGMLSPQAPLAKSPTLHRELRIKTIHSSLMIEGNKLDERTVIVILDGKPSSVTVVTSLRSKTPSVPTTSSPNWIHTLSTTC